jgi:uncharacterized glyoxalase superfamily protein PhnB
MVRPLRLEFPGALYHGTTGDRPRFSPASYYSGCFKTAVCLLLLFARSDVTVQGLTLRSTFDASRSSPSTDAELLGMTFTLGMAQEIIAKELGFESWATLKSGVEQMPTTQSSTAIPNPSVVSVNPQLFVSDVSSACEYYRATLGFRVVFLHGEPPFYGEIERDGVRLNLRYVCEPVFDQEMRERESLLSAYFNVSGVKSLYEQFKEAGADFIQTLKRQPWNAQDFVVRDPYGNLLCFSQTIHR